MSNRTRFGAATLIVVAVACGLFGTDGAKRGPLKGDAEANALDQVLAKRGYVAVPLQRPERSPDLFVEVAVGDRKLVMQVDTGANKTLIHKPVATALKLNVFSLGQTMAGIGRSGIPVETGLADRMSLNGVTVPPLLINVFDDDEWIKQIAKNPGNPRVDGILGADLLIYFNAVVDYADKKLYLLDPVRLEVGLQGEWKAVGGHDGAAWLDEFASGFRLTVSRTDVVIEQSKITPFKLNYKLVLSLKPSPRQFDLVPPAGGNVSFGIYKLDGDKLTVALPLFEHHKFDARPTTFESKRDGGYVVIRFERVPGKK